MSEETTPAPEGADTQEIPAAVPQAQPQAAVPAVAAASRPPMHWSAGLVAAVVIAAVVLLGASFASGFVAGRVSGRFGDARPYLMQRGFPGNQFRGGPMGAPWGNRGLRGPGMGWQFRGQSQIPGTASPTPGRQ